MGVCTLACRVGCRCPGAIPWVRGSGHAPFVEGDTLQALLTALTPRHPVVPRNPPSVGTKLPSLGSGLAGRGLRRVLSLFLPAFITTEDSAPVGGFLTPTLPEQPLLRRPLTKEGWDLRPCHPLPPSSHPFRPRGSKVLTKARPRGWEWEPGWNQCPAAICRPRLLRPRPAQTSDLELGIRRLIDGPTLHRPSTGPPAFGLS